MAKKIIAAVLALLLLMGCAGAETAIERMEGEAYFPSEKDWTYHFVYAYPKLRGDDLASAMVNDTYQMVLDEMLQLVLPMFANAEDMRYTGKNEVNHDYIVTCNNGKFLSIVQRKTQTVEDGALLYTMESQVFDMAGEYLGETLTLRGLVMVGDSSDQIAEALMPVLYQEFLKLQEAGVCRKELTREDFDMEFSPTLHFYADENSSAVFYFPPTLLTEPSFDVPIFPFTPAELEGLLCLQCAAFESGD